MAAATGSLVAAVRDELDRPEDTGAADLSHQLVAGREVGKPGAENVGADPGGVGDDALLLHGRQRGDDARRGQRMPAVGQTAGEDPVVEGVRDGVGDDHAAHRDVAGVHALGERDQVRTDVERIEGEPLAGPGEPAITSSRISTIPYRSAIARTPAR